MSERHNHDWQAADTGYACTECDATTPACNTCTGPHTGTALHTCDHCLNRERRILDDIETARDKIQPDPHAPLTSYSYDLTNRAGDGSLVLPFDLDRFVDDWALGIPGIKTPEGVDELMLEWVARWSEYAGPTNEGAADYLRSHLMWAGNNPDQSGWDDYRAEMRDLLARARTLDPARPERTGEGCLDCGGDLVRRWRRDGLGDDVVCVVCERTYDQPAFRLAVRARYERAAKVAPGMLVTEAEATRMLALGSGTVRKWVERGRLERAAKGSPARYRLADIVDLAPRADREKVG